MRRSRAALNIQLHQPLGREADHPAQKVRVRGLLQKRLKGHSLVGHRRVPRLRWIRNPTLPENGDDHHKPLARYGAMESALASGLLRPTYATSWDTTTDGEKQRKKALAFNLRRSRMGMPDPTRPCGSAKTFAGEQADVEFARREMTNRRQRSRPMTLTLAIRAPAPTAYPR